MDSILVFDNGAETLKFGYASESGPRHIWNCTASFKNQPRKYISNEINELRNTSGVILTRPFERGILTNWQCEMDVWNSAFDMLSIKNSNFNDKGFVLTSPPFIPDSIANDTTEIVFEELGFHSYISRPSCWFSAYNYYQESNIPHTNNDPVPNCCSLVIDSGFSFTHTMPWIDKKTKLSTCRRVNVGGKLLTNYLKELVSYRQVYIKYIHYTVYLIWYYLFIYFTPILLYSMYYVYSII
jgi:actin-related protein 6